MFKTRLDTFGNIFGHFWNFGTFLIFFEVLRSLEPPWNTGKKNFENFDPKQVQNTFGYFWERFWAFLEFSNFLIFWKFFEDSTFHGKLGRNFSKSLPQNTFKTHLDTFGNDFGHFRKFETFFDFFENFRRLDLPWKTGQKFFKKFAPKHVQNMFGYIWEHFWAFLEI